MDHAAYQATQEELRALIAERLGVKAATFPKAVRKAGRLLPAPARAAARDFIAMEARLAHPKLAARTDPSHAQEAAAIVRTALTRHRPGALVARRRSLLAAEIGFKIAVVLVLGLVLLRMGGV